MRFISLMTVTWLLLVSQCWASEPAPKHSKIEKLMQEVNAAKEQAGEHRKIILVARAAKRIPANVKSASNVTT